MVIQVSEETTLSTPKRIHGVWEEEQRQNPVRKSSFCDDVPKPELGPDVTDEEGRV